MTLDRQILPFAVAAAPVVADLITAFEAHATIGPLLDGQLPEELHALLVRGKAVSRSAYESALDARQAAFIAAQ